MDELSLVGGRELGARDELDQREDAPADAPPAKSRATLLSQDAPDAAPASPKPLIAQLRARLTTLVRETGGAAQSAVPASPDWANQVERLRLAQRTRDSRRRAAEQALPGEELSPGVRRIRTLMPAAQCGPRNATAAPWWEARDDIGRAPLIFLDTETTGLAGGTGTLIFLLGLARWQGEHLLVEQWLLTSPNAEAAWLDAFAREVPGDAVLVSFNGKTFDLPLLAARFRLARARNPLTGLRHWDLMHPLRRAFDKRWSDCRLQTAERCLLGIERVDDLPGAFAPRAFHHFLRQGDGAQLIEVVRHNRQDIVSLARLLATLNEVWAEPLRFDADVAAIAERLRKLGRAEQAERMLVDALHHADARRALALHRRRERRWGEVRELLQPLIDAPRPCAQSLERLAKIAEHIERDPARALRLTEQLIAREPAVARHQTRRARLLGRLARAGAALPL